MRRLAAVVLAVASVTSLTACSGEDGERAQQLLARSEGAHAQLTSASFELRMTFSVDGQRFSLLIDGGGYTRGPRAGDQLVNMRTEGVPGGNGLNMQMVMRGRQMTMNINGHNSTIAVPPSAKRQYELSSAIVDLARYVKHVKVREGRIVNGERGATVAGIVDTEGLVKAASRLEGLARASGPAAPEMDDLAERLGDTHAALFISSRTGLIRSAVIGLSVEDDGRKADVDLTYRLKNVNRAIPGL